MEVAKCHPQHTLWALIDQARSLFRLWHAKQWAVCNHLRNPRFIVFLFIFMFFYSQNWQKTKTFDQTFTKTTCKIMLWNVFNYEGAWASCHHVLKTIQFIGWMRKIKIFWNELVKRTALRHEYKLLGGQGYSAFPPKMVWKVLSIWSSLLVISAPSYFLPTLTLQHLPLQLV